MNHAYLLAAERGRIMARAPRLRPHLPQLKPFDSAVRAMSDFRSEPPLTAAEAAAPTQVFDDMFRLGVRALLVVRDLTVVGLVTAEDLCRPSARQRQRVAEIMTAATDVPAIDWQTLQESRISDLIEIFDATGVSHLIVLQSEAVHLSTVRGLIQRERLERQLVYRADV